MTATQPIDAATIESPAPDSNPDNTPRREAQKAADRPGTPVLVRPGMQISFEGQKIYGSWIYGIVLAVTKHGIFVEDTAGEVEGYPWDKVEEEIHIVPGGPDPAYTLEATGQYPPPDGSAPDKPLPNGQAAAPGAPQTAVTPDPYYRATLLLWQAMALIEQGNDELHRYISEGDDVYNWDCPWDECSKVQDLVGKYSYELIRSRGITGNLKPLAVADGPGQPNGGHGLEFIPGLEPVPSINADHEFFIPLKRLLKIIESWRTMELHAVRLKSAFDSMRAFVPEGYPKADAERAADLAGQLTNAIGETKDHLVNCWARGEFIESGDIKFCYDEDYAAVDPGGAA